MNPFNSIENLTSVRYIERLLFVITFYDIWRSNGSNNHYQCRTTLNQVESVKINLLISFFFILAQFQSCQVLEATLKSTDKYILPSIHLWHLFAHLRVYLVSMDFITRIKKRTGTTKNHNHFYFLTIFVIYFLQSMDEAWLLNTLHHLNRSKLLQIHNIIGSFVILWLRTLQIVCLSLYDSNKSLSFETQISDNDKIHK